MTLHMETQPSNFEVDLWAGVVRDRESGRIVARLGHWGRRQRIIATEMFLATHSGPGGIGLFEIAVLWSLWLAAADRFQHLRDLFNPVAWAINKALRPYAWITVKLGRVCWALHPYPKAMSHATVRAAGAIVPLRTAASALIEKDCKRMLSSAMEALGCCGESLQARLLIGASVFCLGEAVDDEVAVETATRLLEYEGNLTLACDRLTYLGHRETRRPSNRWGFVEDAIRHFEQLLELYRELFDKARAFLHRERP